MYCVCQKNMGVCNERTLRTGKMKCLMAISSGWQGRKEGWRKNKTSDLKTNKKIKCLNDTRRYTSTSEQMAQVHIPGPCLSCYSS